MPRPDRHLPVRRRHATQRNPLPREHSQPHMRRREDRRAGRLAQPLPCNSMASSPFVSALVGRRRAVGIDARWLPNRRRPRSFNPDKGESSWETQPSVDRMQARQWPRARPCPHGGHGCRGSSGDQFRRHVEQPGFAALAEGEAPGAGKPVRMQEEPEQQVVAVLYRPGHGLSRRHSSRSRGRRTLHGADRPVSRVPSADDRRLDGRRSKQQRQGTDKIKGSEKERE